MKPVYFVLALVLFIQTGCQKRTYQDPGPSLIYLNFNNKITNAGILPVQFQGDQYVSYTKGIADTCLNLTKTAFYRKPLIIDKGFNNSFREYEGFTILLWLKTDACDPYEYVIAGQKIPTNDFNNFIGWQISKTVTGGWYWQASDGLNHIHYRPLVSQQPLNDGQWHQLGFSVNKKLREARFYFDGNLKAIFSTEQLDNIFPGASLYIGVDPLARYIRQETFNGLIDELGVWSKALSDAQVAYYYQQICGKKLKPFPEYKDSVTVMTWNIWNGGTNRGKFTGIQQITDIIKESKADIISLQETMDAGEIIAGQLDFFLYKRSENLSIISRYPPTRSFNIFQPQHFGAVMLNIGQNRKLLMSPLWLSLQPNLPAYFIKENARSDTIEVREMETRGKEIRFILSELTPLIQEDTPHATIIAGDFNSGSHLDWTTRNKKRHNNLVVNFPASRFMYEAGFFDAYRTLYPDETTFPGYTWSPVYKEGLQTRMDFIYYKGNTLKPSSAKVIDTWPYGFPSDHAAVLVSFIIE
ncbi:endonuclease/exonuclease/phosphatase family protein [Thermophagus xiamenensis]|uniref:Metal-dependent hydrolase, endonuclease/exonuclease/phosphatase family n=1 Tax=Thermophagus xiamenensis TaxID=385682 RepID=A0A1I2EXE1_9BACT|nr:endonuclease/exonuclease/phosphatase family protein [Thermophagus xiamenensis]SFE97545.1 Metal-dependent hydrolase, endonuclease/exonuclease/phosphatase family [Thermophagus xiamenensis]